MQVAYKTTVDLLEKEKKSLLEHNKMIVEQALVDGELIKKLTDEVRQWESTSIKQVAEIDTQKELVSILEEKNRSFAENLRSV